MLQSRHRVQWRGSRGAQAVCVVPNRIGFSPVQRGLPSATRPGRNAVRPDPARSLENPLQQAPLLGLNDRCVAGLLALAEGGILAQALRFLLGINHDTGRRRLAPEHQLVAKALLWPIETGVLIHLAADLRWVGWRDRPPGPMPPGPGCCPRPGRPAPSVAPMPVSAWVRSDCSCGRIAPGCGGGSVKLVGMASGARVVTVNSSGASRTKPKVRLNLVPAAAGQHRATGGQREDSGAMSDR